MQKRKKLRDLFVQEKASTALTPILLTLPRLHSRLGNWTLGEGGSGKLA